MEPYNSLLNFRKHSKLGILFGVYFTPDMIASEDEFVDLFRHGYTVPSKFDPEGVVINKGDYLLVRREERVYEVEAPYTTIGAGDEQAMKNKAK